ncbi:hypothetical protein [Vibrio sp. HN007]|uniref:hypothetical protein n=1 Tax=Vibrio iocasae TaxID=3098914 RepID=UPI0035D4DE3A
MKTRACPFCSGIDLSLEWIESAWGSEDKELHIVCNNCAASAPAYIWNQQQAMDGSTRQSDKNDSPI